VNEAFQAAFEDAEYQQFNEDRLLTPWEVDGEEVQTTWTENLEQYRSVVEEFGIDLAGEQ
jgi:hypothetical protein